MMVQTESDRLAKAASRAVGSTVLCSNQFPARVFGTRLLVDLTLVSG